MERPDIRLKRISNYIEQMPSLSTTVTKVIEICENPASLPNDLGRVISLDPVLTGKVLKLINSAYYGLGNQVSSVTRAIILLGLNTVKNMALSTAVLDTLRDREKAGDLSPDDFWLHSLGVGITAKNLAAFKGVPVAGRDEYFVGGLLHDLGKIVINRLFREEYALVLARARKEKVLLKQVEMEALGLDHEIVGEMIVSKWKLNEAIVAAVRHHHRPEAAPDDNRFFVEVVRISDLFANLGRIGSAGNYFVDETCFEALRERLGITPEFLSGLDGIVAADTEKAKIFLQLGGKG